MWPWRRKPPPPAPLAPEPEPEPTPEDTLGWWTIHGATLLTALHDVKNGSHPDIVYAELYANAEHSHPTDEDP